MSYDVEWSVTVDKIIHTLAALVVDNNIGSTLPLQIVACFVVSTRLAGWLQRSYISWNDGIRN